MSGFSLNAPNRWLAGWLAGKVGRTREAGRHLRDFPRVRRAGLVLRSGHARRYRFGMTDAIAPALLGGVQRGIGTGD